MSIEKIVKQKYENYKIRINRLRRDQWFSGLEKNFIELLKNEGFNIQESSFFNSGSLMRKFGSLSASKETIMGSRYRDLTNEEGDESKINPKEITKYLFNSLFNPERQYIDAHYDQHQAPSYPLVHVHFSGDESEAYHLSDGYMENLEAFLNSFRPRSYFQKQKEDGTHIYLPLLEFNIVDSLYNKLVKSKGNAFFNVPDGRNIHLGYHNFIEMMDNFTRLINRRLSNAPALTHGTKEDLKRASRVAREGLSSVYKKANEFAQQKRKDIAAAGAAGFDRARAFAQQRRKDIAAAGATGFDRARAFAQQRRKDIAAAGATGFDRARAFAQQRRKDIAAAGATGFDRARAFAQQRRKDIAAAGATGFDRASTFARQGGRNIAGISNSAYRGISNVFNKISSRVYPIGRNRGIKSPQRLGPGKGPVIFNPLFDPTIPSPPQSLPGPSSLSSPSPYQNVPDSPRPKPRPRFRNVPNQKSDDDEQLEKLREQSDRERARLVQEAERNLEMEKKEDKFNALPQELRQHNVAKGIIASQRKIYGIKKTNLNNWESPNGKKKLYPKKKLK